MLSEAKNLFALVDEAHRTEYGKFAAHMARTLPNACRLAFTGTPIDKTRASFGSYIHKYTMPQSIADGSTMPIFYESRLPELAIWGKRIDPLFENEFGHLNEEQRNRLKRQEVTEQRIAEATDRVEMIAADIADHYRMNFEPDGFKAEVVYTPGAGRCCLDRHWAEPVCVCRPKNLYIVSDSLYRSGQIIRSGAARLRCMGVKTVVNLRVRGRRDARAGRGRRFILGSSSFKRRI